MENSRATVANGIELGDIPQKMSEMMVTIHRYDQASQEVGKPYESAFMYDISRSGMRILTSSPIHQPTLAIQLQFSSDMVMTRIASVVRHEVYPGGLIWEYGVQFEDLLPESVVSNIRL